VIARLSHPSSTSYLVSTPIPSPLLNLTDFSFFATAHNSLMIRPRATASPTRKKPDPLARLTTPFKCPGSAAPKRVTALPPRKRRKVSYKDASADDCDDDSGFKPDGGNGEDREVLGNLQVNKAFPVFKPKDKDTVFRARFAVPLADKNAGGYNPHRPAPALGMRKSANFIARPLHDPSGEFAIVLYDPTVDDKKIEIIEQDGEAPKLEVKPISKVHRSLKEILGLDQAKEKEVPKVPVVIDPRLAKVLRPHQIEGVRFLYRCTTSLVDSGAKGCIMADEMGLGKTVGLPLEQALLAFAVAYRPHDSFNALPSCGHCSSSRRSQGSLPFRNV